MILLSNPLYLINFSRGTNGKLHQQRSRTPFVLLIIQPTGTSSGEDAERAICVLRQRKAKRWTSSNELGWADIIYSQHGREKRHAFWGIGNPNPANLRLSQRGLCSLQFGTEGNLIWYCPPLLDGHGPMPWLTQRAGAVIRAISIANISHPPNELHRPWWMGRSDESTCAIFLHTDVFATWVIEATSGGIRNSWEGTNAFRCGDSS